MIALFWHTWRQSRNGARPRRGEYIVQSHGTESAAFGVETFEYVDLSIARCQFESKDNKGISMPYRLLAASELAEFLRALAHPRRIQIIEELRTGERDVASLAKATELAHSGVSQHLMVLRAHRIVTERRQGRRVFYRLRSLALADWLVQGMNFLPPVCQQTDEVRKAIKKARSKWSDQSSGSR